jgi:oxygen-independent coproporphyrinogen III oxidase
MKPSPTFLKYARQNTPRYTSYPTAPHFHGGVNAGVFAQWLMGLKPDASGSLYVHIPYCREMCWYCGCSTRATRKTEPVAAYTETLLTEIDLAAATFAQKPSIAHIHFGGGTPTILTEAQFTAVMDRIRMRFSVSETAEIAIEIDPRIFTASKAGHLARCGVNRASIGVQTFDADVQAKINRIQPADTVRACVQNLRTAGIGHISFDLLYGLPGQTLESCRDTVSTALDLEPDRLSVFGYAHVPHMKRHQKLIRNDDLPGPELRIEQALAIAHAVQSSGFIPIGIDHYARPDDDMGRMIAASKIRRNFQGYTTDQSEFLLGLGASAISRTPMGYAQNTPDVAAWTRAIKAGHLATARGIALESDDRARGDIIEQLMCGLEVDLDKVASVFEGSVGMPDMDDLIEDGIVRRQGNRITLAKDSRMLARVVAARFDSYLTASKTARHSASV